MRKSKELISEKEVELTEQTILASILNYPNSYLEMTTFGLNAEHFSIPDCRKFFEEIKNFVDGAHDASQIEFSVIAQRVFKAGESMQVLCSKLANLEGVLLWKPFVERLFEFTAIRNIERAFRLFKEHLLDGGNFQENLYALKTNVASADVGEEMKCSNMEQLIDAMVADFSLRKSNEENGITNFITSGYRDLDKIIDGYEETHLNILAGRPGTGKTSLLVSTVAKMITRKEPVPCLIFSLEMSKLALTYRLAAVVSDVPARCLKKGFIPPLFRDKFKAAVRLLKTLPLHIIDDSMNIDEIRSAILHYKQKYNIKFVGVDYLQLIKPRDKKLQREQQVSEISAGLKQIAKKTNLSILTLAQLNRASEKEDREPRASDLRESGSLEQDADKIIILSPVCEAGKECSSRNSAVDAFVVKNREGITEKATLFFNRSLTRYEDLNAPEAEAPAQTILL